MSDSNDDERELHRQHRATLQEAIAQYNEGGADYWEANAALIEFAATSTDPGINLRVIIAETPKGLPIPVLLVTVPNDVAAENGVIIPPGKTATMPVAILPPQSAFEALLPGAVAEQRGNGNGK